MAHFTFLPEEIHPGYATATTVLVTGAAWAYAFFPTHHRPMIDTCIDEQ